MNLDNEEKSKRTPGAKTPEKKKLTRKEKKALKKAEALASVHVVTAPTPNLMGKEETAEGSTEEVEAKLDLSPVEVIPAPHYTAWEKISPPARRKKQITNMESGFREVLALVHSMRNNQEVLLESFKKLPEAVDSVKKLADHSAQQSELLKAMNDQMGTGSAGDFNKTLTSMDQTTQLLLERAQRSEERLYGMLKGAQRRITFMTLLVLMLFIGALAAAMFIVFPEKTNELLNRKASRPTEQVVDPQAVAVAEAETSAESASENLEVSKPMEEETLPEALENETPSEEEPPTLEELAEAAAEVVETQVSATATEIVETIAIEEPQAEEAVSLPKNELDEENVDEPNETIEAEESTSVEETTPTPLPESD